jgi:hypothetical protein
MILAGSLVMAGPKVVLAADGMTETGTTTYEVLPESSQIKVTVTVSIYNGRPSQVEPGGVRYYFWNSTKIGVEKEAGAVSVGSDAGAVQQSEASSDRYYRYLTLSYPNVYYGQTRVVTATYTIPAAPHAPGGFRAGTAYASLCAMGNGQDVGTISVVLPEGFTFHNDAGGNMSPADAPAGKLTYTSGTVDAPYKFWTCFDAERETSLTHSSVAAGGQQFDLQAWPEDPSWSASVGADVSADVPALESLTGLKMPGGTVDILEAGDQQLGEYGGIYNSGTSTAQIPETIQKDTVAHELSHIWFNYTLFSDKWMSEGLAGFSEQAAGEGNFTPCVNPGDYPGTGAPNLMRWQLLTNNSTALDDQVSTYQYEAACYIFTTLAADMGPANLKLVIEAAYADQMAYAGGTPEKPSGASLPLTSKELLDLIDERGMVPAGADLDTAQSLLATYGIFDATSLAGRSAARSTYHALVTAAKTWKLPLAIRQPMSKWTFESATTAMAAAKKILDSRDSIQKLIPSFSLDGTTLQKQFEAATTQADLDALLTLIQKQADAAAKVDQATRLSNGNRSIPQSIGLLGTDVQTPLAQAKTDLANVKSESATTAAQEVIDTIDKSNDQGLLRVGLVAGTLAAILLLLALVIFLRQRRPTVVVLGPGSGPVGPVILLPTGGSEAWPGNEQWQQPPPPAWQPGGWQNADPAAPAAPNPAPDEAPPADRGGGIVAVPPDSSATPGPTEL